MNAFPVILVVMTWMAPNFSGAWRFNDTWIKIDHKGQSVAVQFRAKDDQQHWTYTIGQESKGELHGGAMTSHAVWEGDTLVIRSVVLYGKKELRLVDRWSISADGNQFTLHEKHQFDTEPEGESTRVFHRMQDDAWPADSNKNAEDVYKNVQVFKGVPAARVLPVMNSLNRWLGVSCDHCHVGAEYDKDDKPAKQTARKMFLMVRQIGQDNFGGNNPVTCWTCHRGQVKPEMLPAQ